jgi:hypothetical protein
VGKVAKTNVLRQSSGNVRTALWREELRVVGMEDAGTDVIETVKVFQKYTKED